MAADNRWKAILFFGMPGSGKGTQGKAVGGIPGFIHVATGDIFRNLNQLGQLGKEVAAYTTAGKLVPDDLTVQIWRNHMALLIKQQAFDPEKQTAIFDGIPRTYSQAKIIDQYVRVLRIFNLRLRDREEAVHRIRIRALKENRTDDAREDVIRGRLDTFDRDTAQTLGFYSPDLIREIDASRRPIDVLCELACAIAGIEDA